MDGSSSFADFGSSASSEWRRVSVQLPSLWSRRRPRLQTSPQRSRPTTWRDTVDYGSVVADIAVTGDGIRRSGCSSRSPTRSAAPSSPTGASRRSRSGPQAPAAGPRGPPHGRGPDHPYPRDEWRITQTPGRPKARAFIGLGSNLGDRMSYLAVSRSRPPGRGQGLAGLRDRAGRRTAGQDPYLNVVVELATDLSRTESCWSRAAGSRPQAGRERTVHDGPRTLDVDILLVGEEAVDEPRPRGPPPPHVGAPFRRRAPRGPGPGAGRSDGSGP